MLENIWRYNINFGEHGGIVIATSKKDAEEKIKRKYRRNDFTVWRMIYDDFFDENNPDVFDIY